MTHNPVVFEMKNLRLIIGIVVILAIVCSPALAISLADWRQSHSSFPEMKSKLPTLVVPTPNPTTTPTPDENNCYSPCPVAPLFVHSTPTEAHVFIDGSNRGSTPIGFYDLSVGTHQLRVSRVGYEDYSTEIVIPEPSWRCVCQSCLAGEWGWVRGACKINDISINVTLKKDESTPIIVPTPNPTPSVYDDENDGSLKPFDKSRFNTKLRDINISHGWRIPKPINRG
jgi:hypothetical protein